MNPRTLVLSGSVERTAFSEQKENKGYLIVNLSTGEKPGGQLDNVVFHPLPARPMETLDIRLDHQTDGEILKQLQNPGWQQLHRICGAHSPAGGNQ